MDLEADQPCSAHEVAEVPTADNQKDSTFAQENVRISRR
jgi:hypothetical protein